MALRKNFSTELSDVDALKRVAQRAGYIQTRGPDKGEGSIRQMLEALAVGEAIVMRKPARARSAAAKRLAARGLIVPSDPSYRFPSFMPIALPGKPLSEVIIEERR